MKIGGQEEEEDKSNTTAFPGEHLPQQAHPTMQPVSVHLQSLSQLGSQ
jgi:hypothetical protein